MLRYRLPDGRSWKRLWEGWVGSFTILLALLEYRVRKISRMEGRGAQMILQLCSLSAGGSCYTTVPIPYSDAAGRHTLNGSPVEGVEDGWREPSLFSRRRKCRRCCAFLEIDMVLVVQERSSVMCILRYLVLLTLSTVELSMVSGGWSMEFLLKSITTSFDLLTLRDRLFAPHHSARCATFSL